MKNIQYEYIDKNMIPIIKVLNEKGYETYSCCEGHTEKTSRVLTFIAFDKNYEFPIKPPMYNIYKHNYYKRKHSFLKIKILRPHSTFGKGVVYYYYGTFCDSNEIKEKERIKLIKDLQEWANRLPYNCD